MLEKSVGKQGSLAKNAENYHQRKSMLKREGKSGQGQVQPVNFPTILPAPLVMVSQDSNAHGIQFVTTVPMLGAHQPQLGQATITQSVGMIPSAPQTAALQQDMRATLPRLGIPQQQSFGILQQAILGQTPIVQIPVISPSHEVESFVVPKGQDTAHELVEQKLKEKKIQKLRFVHVAPVVEIDASTVQSFVKKVRVPHKMPFENQTLWVSQSCKLHISRTVDHRQVVQSDACAGYSRGRSKTFYQQVCAWICDRIVKDCGIIIRYLDENTTFSSRVFVSFETNEICGLKHVWPPSDFTCNFCISSKMHDQRTIAESLKFQFVAQFDQATRKIVFMEIMELEFGAYVTFSLYHLHELQLLTKGMGLEKCNSRYLSCQDPKQCKYPGLFPSEIHCADTRTNSECQIATSFSVDKLYCSDLVTLANRYLKEVISRCNDSQQGSAHRIQVENPIASRNRTENLCKPNAHNTANLESCSTELAAEEIKNSAKNSDGNVRNETSVWEIRNVTENVDEKTAVDGSLDVCACDKRLNSLSHILIYEGRVCEDETSKPSGMCFFHGYPFTIELVLDLGSTGLGGCTPQKNVWLLGTEDNYQQLDTRIIKHVFMRLSDVELKNASVVDETMKVCDGSVVTGCHAKACDQGISEVELCQRTLIRISANMLFRCVNVCYWRGTGPNLLSVKILKWKITISRNHLDCFMGDVQGEVSIKLAHDKSLYLISQNNTLRCCLKHCQCQLKFRDSESRSQVKFKSAPKTIVVSNILCECKAKRNFLKHIDVRYVSLLLAHKSMDQWQQGHLNSKHGDDANLKWKVKRNDRCSRYFERSQVLLAISGGQHERLQDYDSQLNFDRINKENTSEGVSLTDFEAKTEVVLKGSGFCSYPDIEIGQQNMENILTASFHCGTVSNLCLGEYTFVRTPVLRKFVDLDMTVSIIGKKRLFGFRLLRRLGQNVDKDSDIIIDSEIHVRVLHVSCVLNAISGQQIFKLISQSYHFLHGALLKVIKIVFLEARAEILEPQVDFSEPLNFRLNVIFSNDLEQQDLTNYVYSCHYDRTRMFIAWNVFVWGVLLWIRLQLCRHYDHHNLKNLKRTRVYDEDILIECTSGRGGMVHEQPTPCICQHGQNELLSRAKVLWLTRLKLLKKSKKLHHVFPGERDDNSRRPKTIKDTTHATQNPRGVR